MFSLMRHSAEVGESSGITRGDWAAVVVAIALGIVATVAAVMIARWQRRRSLDDAADDRRHADAREAEAALRRRKLPRQEALRADYHSTRKLLERAEDIADRILDLSRGGPLTEYEMNVLDLRQLQTDCAQLAGRVLLALDGQLAIVAAAIGEMARFGLDDQAGCRDCRRSILQDRAARILKEEIDVAWGRLHASGQFDD